MYDSNGTTLTKEMIENAAITAASTAGWINPTMFYMWHDYDRSYARTPYDGIIIVNEDLRAFAELHRFLIKLKVCKFSTEEDYSFMDGDGARRLKKKCIKLFKKEQSIKNKKKEQRRRMYENLPDYKRSLSRHSGRCL